MRLSVLLFSQYGRMPSTENKREALVMRGYFTASGYYGLVDGVYMLFASEGDYYEFMEDAA